MAGSYHQSGYPLHVPARPPVPQSHETAKRSSGRLVGDPLPPYRDQNSNVSGRPPSTTKINRQHIAKSSSDQRRHNNDPRQHIELSTFPQPTSKNAHEAPYYPKGEDPNVSQYLQPPGKNVDYRLGENPASENAALHRAKRRKQRPRSISERNSDNTQGPTEKTVSRPRSGSYDKNRQRVPVDVPRYDISTRGNGHHQFAQDHQKPQSRIPQQEGPRHPARYGSPERPQSGILHKGNAHHTPRYGSPERPQSGVSHKGNAHHTPRYGSPERPQSGVSHKGNAHHTPRYSSPERPRSGFSHQQRNQYNPLHHSPERQQSGRPRSGSGSRPNRNSQNWSKSNGKEPSGPYCTMEENPNKRRSHRRDHMNDSRERTQGFSNRESHSDSPHRTRVSQPGQASGILSPVETQRERTFTGGSQHDSSLRLLTSPDRPVFSPDPYLSLGSSPKAGIAGDRSFRYQDTSMEYNACMADTSPQYEKELYDAKLNTMMDITKNAKRNNPFWNKHREPERSELLKTSRSPDPVNSDEGIRESKTHRDNDVDDVDTGCCKKCCKRCVHSPVGWCAAGCFGATLTFLFAINTDYLPYISKPWMGNLLPTDKVYWGESPYGVYTLIVLWGVHFLRRFAEVLFVHDYRRRFHPVEAIGVNLYYWIFGFLIGYSCSYELGYRPPKNYFLFTGVVIFACGEIGNCICHVALRRLRKRRYSRQQMRLLESQHVVPSGKPFRCTSFPHYMFEMITWVGFTFCSFTMMAIIFSGLNVVILFIYGILRRRAYLYEFNGKHGLPNYT